MKVKSRGQVGHYDDGKLQALGRMYGQDVQGVRVEDGFALLLFFSSQQVEANHEICEGAAEFAGEIEELAHVGHGLLSALAIAEKAPGPSVFEDGVQKLDEGHAIAQPFPVLEPGDRVLGGLLVRRGEALTLIGVREVLCEPPTLGRGQCVQGVIREAEVRRAQRAHQGDAVAGVAQDAEDISEVVDFLALVKPPAAGHLEGNAAGPQRVFVREEIAATAQEQGDVSGNGRAQALLVGDLQVAAR